MTAVQNTLLSLPKYFHKSALLYRLHRALNEYILSDLRGMLLPNQPPGPFVVAAILGTILSFMPAPFLDSLLVGLIFARFRKINRSALIVSRIIWNDLIVVPLYMPGFRLGMRLIEPFSKNEPTFAIKIIGFSLGLLLLTVAAAAVSAGTMSALVLIFQRWRRRPA
jgi:hypothetical protein